MYFLNVKPTSCAKALLALSLLLFTACGALQQKENSLHTSALEQEAITLEKEVAAISQPVTREVKTSNKFIETNEAVTEAVEPAHAEDDLPIEKVVELPKDSPAVAESTTQVGGSLFIDTTEDSEELSLNEQEANDRNLWLRIKRGFTFPTRYPLDNPKHTQRVTHYLSRLEKSPHHFKGLANKARPYLYYVVSELEKNNMPLEIALLPIVESRYDPFAYSPGRAAGLWQFIPSTGKRFGLIQDWWQDERRDTIAATGAAIQYLLFLHNRFDNDWLLALAAYNAGQGNVAKAIRKNKKLGKPTDYWSLDLPKETRHYVPQLLAWREFLREADSSVIASGYIANKPFFDVVDVGSQIDLAQAAQLADIDIDSLYQLNPSYSRWATDPQSPHFLLVPVANKFNFEQALETIPVSQRLVWQRYTVRKGDVLGKIADKFSTSTTIIASSNHLKSNVIRVGQVLLIPSAKEKGEYYTKSVEQRLAKRQNRSGSNNTKVKHTVKSGETLWDIGKKYGVSSSAIARWNNMAPKDVLRINQKLVIWQKGNTQIAAAKNERRKLFYRVKNGDSLSSIANRFNVAIGDIKRWNSSARDKYIQPGQLLTLYIAITNR